MAYHKERHSRFNRMLSHFSSTTHANKLWSRTRIYARENAQSARKKQSKMHSKCS